MYGRNYEHNTLYWNYDIISTINYILGKNYSLNRGSIYIWSINDSLVFYDMKDSNYGGCLEIHKDGELYTSLSSTVLDVKGDDFVFNRDKIVKFLNNHIK